MRSVQYSSKSLADNVHKLTQTVPEPQKCTFVSIYAPARTLNHAHIASEPFLKCLTMCWKNIEKSKFSKFIWFFFTFTQILPKSMHFGVESPYSSILQFLFLVSCKIWPTVPKNHRNFENFDFSIFFSTSTSILKKVPGRYGHDSGSLREHKLTQSYTFEALQPRGINGFQGMNTLWSKINGFRSESWWICLKIADFIKL